MQETRIIRTKDGREITAICYSSDEHATKVMIIAPDAAVTQCHYKPLALLFRQLDYDVVTFDYRGIGNSGSSQLKAYSSGLHLWAVQDTDAVIRFVKTHYLNKEIIFIGHGISGEIVALSQASQYIHKLVLINSALSCKRLWPFRDKVRIWWLKLAARILTATVGYFPGGHLGFKRDLPRGVVKEWINWCSLPNGLFDAYPENNFRKLQIPIMAFSFSDDWLSPVKAVKELLNGFCDATITWHHLSPKELNVRKVGHKGFFDPTMKSSLWVMMDKWLNADHRKEEAILDREAVFK